MRDFCFFLSYLIECSVGFIIFSFPLDKSNLHARIDLYVYFADLAQLVEQRTRNA